MGVVVSTVQLNKTITKAVDDYRNEPSQWIADYVAPRFPVTEKTGYLPRFGRSNQKSLNGKVSPSSPSPEMDYNIGTTEYKCEVYRLAATLPYELEVFDNTGMLSAANLGLQVAEAMQIERELEVATLLVDTSNSVTAQSAPSTRWNKTGGDPCASVATAMGTIDDAINRLPQYMLVTRDVGFYLRQHVAAINGNGGNASLASLEQVAAYLGVKEVRIMRASYNSAKPGVSTAVGAKVMAANKAWVFYKADNMSMFTPSWMSTPYVPSLSDSRAVKIDDPQGLKVLSRDCRDLVVVDKTACVYIATPLT
jgi:hypothetical protein